MNLLDGAMDERDTLLRYCFEELQAYDSRLNAKKSSRSENIPIKFCKTANEEISNFLSILYKCVEIGYFPYSLKLAEVIPVHKSG